MKQRSENKAAGSILSRIRERLSSEEKLQEKDELLQKAESMFGPLTRREMTELGLEPQNAPASAIAQDRQTFFQKMEIIIAVAACVSFLAAFFCVSVLIN